MCSVRTRTREFSWTFLLAPVAFPILGADFLSNFRLLVDISNKRLVAHGGKLIQLEQGKPTNAAVVTGVVSVAPLPAVAPSTPSLPLVEAPYSGSSGPPVANRRARAARKSKAVAAALPLVVPPSTPSIPTVEAPSTGGGSSGQLAASQHVGDAKRLLHKYQAVVGASKRLPLVKHAVEHLIETNTIRPVASRYRRLDPEWLAATKAKFAPMESQGIIRRS